MTQPGTNDPVDQPEGNREHRMLRPLVIMCGLMMAAGMAMPAWMQSAPPRPVTLGNISEAHLVEIRDQGGETRYSGEFRSRVDAVGNVEKDAALLNVRDRAVIGEVEIEIPAAGTVNRRPELEVDMMGLAPRAVYHVFIDDRLVGMFTTDDRGSIDMELQEGETPPAPTWTAGGPPPAS